MKLIILMYSGCHIRISPALTMKSSEFCSHRVISISMILRLVFPYTALVLNLERALRKAYKDKEYALLHGLC
jgi:hypothetical protein